MYHCIYYQRSILRHTPLLRKPFSTRCAFAVVAEFCRRPLMEAWRGFDDGSIDGGSSELSMCLVEPLSWCAMLTLPASRCLCHSPTITGRSLPSKLLFCLPIYLFLKILNHDYRPCLKGNGYQGKAPASTSTDVTSAEVDTHRVGGRDWASKSSAKGSQEKSGVPQCYRGADGTRSRNIYESDRAIYFHQLPWTTKLTAGSGEHVEA